jgi:hypothetical protein
VLLNGDTYYEADDKSCPAHDFFSAVFGRMGADYRKFYKMDALSKLGFIASELLLKGVDKGAPKEDVGMALFNRSSSLETDCRYHKTIRDKNNFFPSPSEFVYTLPNIVTGELAIRNKIYGETAFYITSDFQSDTVCETIDNMINFAGMKYVLAGWTEVDAFTGEFDCLMLLCEAGNVSGPESVIDTESTSNGNAEKKITMTLNSDNLCSLYNKY